MFQFTTTNIVNSLYWDGYKAKKGEKYNTKHEAENVHALITADDDTLYIKGINNFKKDNVVSIYKAESREETLGQVKIDFSDIASYVPLSREDGSTPVKRGEILRLNMYIGLSQGSNDAMYSNDSYFKGKPEYIEFTWLGDATTTLTKLVKDIKRLNLNFDDEKAFDVSIDGTTLVIDAVNEYQRFVKCDIEYLDKTAYQGMGEWELVTDSSEESISEITQGQEGFGTSAWILHNLRIPTSARDSMFSPNFEETPHEGATYTQYTIHYCKRRGSLGMNAVGMQATSHTTHVFYVLDSLVEDFDTAIEEAGLTEKMKTVSVEDDVYTEE